MDYTVTNFVIYHGVTIDFELFIILDDVLPLDIGVIPLIYICAQINVHLYEFNVNFAFCCVQLANKFWSHCLTNGLEVSLDPPGFIGNTDIINFHEALLSFGS